MPMQELPGATSETGNNIRAELSRKRMTQADLAEHLLLSPAAVSRRLSGLTPFREHEIRAAAQLLGLTPAALLGETEQVA